MSTRRVAVAPIFRSETQLRILATTYLDPTRRFTMPALVRRTALPQPSVSRETGRLIEAGFLESELTGGRRTVWAATTSPIFVELQSLLLKTVGPKTEIEKSLADVDGIEDAYIFGSWARRYLGELGAQPGDVDVILVGDVDVNAVRKKTDIVSGALGRDVSVSVVSSLEWHRPKSGFLKQVRSAPLVQLDLPDRAR